MSQEAPGRRVTTTSILPHARTHRLSLHLFTKKNGTRSMAIPHSPVAKVDNLLPYDDLITWPAQHNKAYCRDESERFLVVLDRDAFHPSLTRDDFIDLCIITLAMVVGKSFLDERIMVARHRLETFRDDAPLSLLFMENRQEEARKRICSINYNRGFSFECIGLGEYYWQIMEVPNVKFVFPESECGGEPIDLTDPSMLRTSSLTAARRVMRKIRDPVQSQMYAPSSTYEKDTLQDLSFSNKNGFADEEGSTSIEAKFVNEDMEEEDEEDDDDDDDYVARLLAVTRAFTGQDFIHHVVVLDGLDPNLTRDERIGIYVKTLAVVLGSAEEAKKNIYSIYTKDKLAFGCTGLGLGESYWKIFDVPHVRWVFPDSYSDRKNRVYGGYLVASILGEPYDPEVRVLPLPRSTSTQH